MPQSLDVMVKCRITPDTEDHITLICKENTRNYGRDYTVSDFLRDAISLHLAYHKSRDALLAHRDILPLLLERLPKRM